MTPSCVHASGGMVTRRKAKRAEVPGPLPSNGSGPPSVCDVQRWLDSCMQSSLEVRALKP